MDRGEFQIEICAGGVESCQAALQGGADRVELCAALPEGGITPSYGEIKVAREVLDDKAAMHVMIRPRGGDFVYSRLELDRMAVDIDVCRLLGADGVVFGCLLPDGSIDEQACTRLMRHARGMNVTFHRAFDLCRDPL
ncbi:MAG: copper homeostasis protein CutC, partial [Bacteroidales bacterium]|nr:copper homeostasis protein CutC [Bacteroidales bacterium]